MIFISIRLATTGEKDIFFSPSLQALIFFRHLTEKQQKNIKHNLHILSFQSGNHSYPFQEHICYVLVFLLFQNNYFVFFYYKSF